MREQWFTILLFHELRSGWTTGTYQKICKHYHITEYIIKMGGNYS